MDSDIRSECSHSLGFPIRKSPDHSLVAASRGLSQLLASFIAFLRQGIHTHALSSLTIKSTSHTTRRYFLCAYILVSTTLPYLRPVPQDKLGTLPSFVCPSNIQLSKISIASATGGREALPHSCGFADWWAWVELNYRPHPYQGCALAN